MPSSGPSPAPDTASTLMRARLAQGLTLEGLAAMIKVTPAKLAALETGRYQDLPDAAFTRALAMTVCRVLKLDPAPVLASLPAAQPVSLLPSEQRAVPFDASRTKLRLNMDLSPSRVRWPGMLSLQWLAPMVVLVAALVVYLWPQQVNWPEWWSSMTAGLQSDSDPQPEAATGASSMNSPEPEPAMAMPVDASPALADPEAAASSSQASIVQPLALDLRAETAQSLTTGQSGATSDASGSPLVMVASEPSWVEVRDGSGKRLMSRHVEAGETIGLDGKPPLTVRIGNAGGLQVSYLGHQVELAAFTRNNVARLELK